MADSKHTPLPWRFAPAGGNMSKNYAQPFAIAQAGEANLIGGCFGDVRGGHDVAEANAAFIVRAVNAHDELVGALREGVEIEQGDLVGREWKEAVHAWLSKARAAIAKAEARHA